MPGDEQLMERIAAGDLPALRLLMERWEGPAKRYAFRVFGDHQLAEDVAQETFVRLYRAAHRYRPDARFSTYFYTVLGNLCRDQLRKARRRQEGGETIEDSFVLDASVAHPGAHRPDVLAEAEEDRMLVRRVVATLPEKHMRALSLREFEGLSYDEIATVMEATLAEVKTWIHRGRKRLAERLRRIVEREVRS